MDSFAGMTSCRVRIIEPGPFMGITGTVWRRRYQDDSAWIDLDEWPDGEQRALPVGDDRQNHRLFWPNECEELT
ncbi:MAG: hypothetical protein K2P78_14600 [Gemmataceae bacterium]|nr:hypothetical protein [Gemmataceae bacterium]